MNRDSLFILEDDKHKNKPAFYAACDALRCVLKTCFFSKLRKGVFRDLIDHVQGHVHVADADGE